METNSERYPQGRLAACLLPWTEDFKLDVPVFENHVQTTIDDGFKCMYLLGTASEGYALDEDLFKQVVEIFAGKTVRPGLDPQVGIIHTSMRQMIKRMEFCHDLGIRMFQMTLPCWGRLDDLELQEFFKTVCGAFPDCRFLHYNRGSSAKRFLTGKDYRRIADEVPNLVATKNSGSDYRATAALLIHAPDLQHFLLESNFAMGCTVGRCSLLCSYDALFPKTTARFFEAGVKKALPELFRITCLFYEFGEKLFAHCTRDMIDPSYDKTFAWLRNPRFSNRLLPPYVGLSAQESGICRQVYEEGYSHID